MAEKYDAISLGTCKTNTTEQSQSTATVKPFMLWSYAQEEALKAVSDYDASTGTNRLITDPERRAKRIASRYADLYFKSAEKSNGKIQMYWTALAAFVVKDVVEAFRFSREEVLSRNLDDTGVSDDVATGLRTAPVVSEIGAMVMGSITPPLEHVMRTYAALAKGNLWLFMDVYPWLWFFLEYGINRQGELLESRLSECMEQRNSSDLQCQTNQAVENLPFGPAWLNRANSYLASDPLRAEIQQLMVDDGRRAWQTNRGYTYLDQRPAMGRTPKIPQPQALTADSRATMARVNLIASTKAEKLDSGYRTPPGKYWKTFYDGYGALKAEAAEMKRVINDKKMLGALLEMRQFKVNAEIRKTYEQYYLQKSAPDNSTRFRFQKSELEYLAQHEQCNVLQKILYDDADLAKTLAMNHTVSRFTSGWLSPKVQLVYSFDPRVSDPDLVTVFDPPENLKDQFLKGGTEDLSNVDDRMAFVAKIARDFNRLMEERRPYMNAELQKIRDWWSA